MSKVKPPTKRKQFPRDVKTQKIEIKVVRARPRDVFRQRFRSRGKSQKEEKEDERKKVTTPLAPTPFLFFPQSVCLCSYFLAPTPLLSNPQQMHSNDNHGLSSPIIITWCSAISPGVPGKRAAQPDVPAKPPPPAAAATPTAAATAAARLTQKKEASRVAAVDQSGNAGCICDMWMRAQYCRHNAPYPRTAHTSATAAAAAVHVIVTAAGVLVFLLVGILYVRAYVLFWCYCCLLVAATLFWECMRVLSWAKKKRGEEGRRGLVHPLRKS